MFQPDTILFFIRFRMYNGSPPKVKHADKACFAFYVFKQTAFGKHPTAEQGECNALLMPICVYNRMGDLAQTIIFYVLQKKQLKNKKRHHFDALAAESGFEPEQSESESLVLPLHNSAICLFQTTII